MSRSEQTPTDTITEALETMPAASPHDRRAQGRNVIYASTIVAGTAFEVLHEGAVVIDDGVISWIGPATSAPPADHTLSDVTLVPGLIDTHVHLWTDSGPMSERAGTDSQIMLQMVSNAAEFLRAGVTTVRDLGSPGVLAGELRDAVAAHRVEGPRILAANRVITTTGGHGHQMGIECDDAADLKRAVRQLVKDGSDWIKVMASGGFVHVRRPEGVGPYLPLFSSDEMRVVIDESHRAGLPVAAHSQNRDAIEIVLDSGIDTIEHCTFSARPQATLDEQLVDRIASSGTPVIPTVNNYWLTVGVPWAPKDVALRNLQRLHELGVRLVAGTDSGIPTTTPDLYSRGLEVFSEIGMNGREILAAATTDAAAAIGLASTTGSITVGHCADLVALRGDPLTDVSAYSRPVVVVHRGQMIWLEQPVAAGVISG